MGFAKQKRPEWTPGLAESVQNISLSGASGISPTVVTPRGVTFITTTGTGAGWTLNLAPPGVGGQRKQILIFLSGASTMPVTVRTASSSQVFYGSTKNSISMTTAAGSTQPASIGLISRSSVQWAIASLTATASTYIPFYTSTGSTA